MFLHFLYVSFVQILYVLPYFLVMFKTATLECFLQFKRLIITRWRVCTVRRILQNFPPYQSFALRWLVIKFGFAMKKNYNFDRFSLHFSSKWQLCSISEVWGCQSAFLLSLLFLHSILLRSDVTMRECIQILLHVRIRSKNDSPSCWNRLFHNRIGHLTAFQVQS